MKWRIKATNYFEVAWFCYIIIIIIAFSNPQVAWSLISLYIYISYLAGGFKHFVFFHILGIILPNWLIVFKMVETTNHIYIYFYLFVYLPYIFHFRVDDPQFPSERTHRSQVTDTDRHEMVLKDDPTWAWQGGEPLSTWHRGYLEIATLSWG